MAIILSPLKKAFLSLTTAVDRAKLNPSDLEVRDACIQRFEYTYELAIKIIKRFIKEEQSATENINQLNFRDLLRLAGEIGLINTVEPWFEFREARNQTSHTYDDNKATEVFKVIINFIPHIQTLIEQLNQRIKKHD
ncbi:MAG: nucleotidyltransferase substrate binding protein [Gammaproteobacteria bacterium]|jgi:nucleotidyltransferase substrate binding protein (TIGR01987 family)